jgi:hypothetical protein
MRFATTLAGAVATLPLALGLSIAAPGCGSGEPQVDRSAFYTPESLAEELALRYRTLKPEARKFTRAAASSSKSARRAAALDRARQAEKKGGGGDEPKKRTGPETLDDIMADIEAKIDKIPGTARPEACKKMSDALPTDATLSADEKKLLSGRLEEMGGS